MFFTNGIYMDGGSELIAEPYSGGGYPNAINDIKTILKFSMESGAGVAYSSNWNTIYNYVNTYSLIVTGTSAGAHLAVMGAGDYGTQTGIWPLAVCSVAGPMDLVYSPYGYNDNPLDSPVQDIANSFSNPNGSGGSNGYNDANARASSPRYKYGTSSSPGDWYTALNASSCKFNFIQNTNDTLVKTTMVAPFINSLPGAKVTLQTVTEGTVTPGVYDHNYTTSLSNHVKYFANISFPSTSPVTTSVTTTYDIPYGTKRLQKVDLLVPATTPRGVIIFIHGGGWSGGSKSSSGFSPGEAAYTNNDNAEVQLIAQAGYVVINCNYRLTSLDSYGYGGDPALVY
jgi:hypothetical protein